MADSLYSVSTMRGDSIMDPENDIANPLEIRLIVVGEKCKNNTELQTALQKFGHIIHYSQRGDEYLKNPTGEFDTIFVVDDFEDEGFRRLHAIAEGRIMGPSILIKAAKDNEPVPYNTRPLFCGSMQQLVLCFTGFKKKEELIRLVDLVHHMGGSIRKDFSPRVTHLVANCTAGEKYRVAVSRDTPIMSDDWILKLWEERHNIDTSAVDENMSKYKVSPFTYCCLSFYGFPDEEQRHMEEIAVSNGGSCADAGSPSCTHLVVDEHTIKHIPAEIKAHNKLHVVKSEWFWGSIQMDACADESMYTFEEPQANDTPTSAKNHTPRQSGGRGRKRARLRDNLAQLASEGELDSPMFMPKRRSNEVTRLSMSNSFLDATNDNSGLDSATPAPVVPSGKVTARKQVAMELLQTETNYVGILQTILKVFKEEIERPDQPGGPLLSATDIKLVFGQIPPLYDVHCSLQQNLQDLMTAWKEENSIGDIFVKHAEGLLKAYPPFVNFYEKTKATIVKCDRTLPRFHAFLKVCQSKPQCGRQKLTELLIRPVQRLPSVLLLLKDLLKKTNKNNPDHVALEDAISKLEEVMTHINEDKRKTEGQVVMFDIMNDIDNCPPILLSSHRSFIMKVDVVEITDTLSGKGDNITLFLFSDSLEMCKRRTKVLNSLKSPGGAKTPQKAYKHIDMMPLSCIKRVVDIFETPECKNVFALVTKKFEEKEKLYAFILDEEAPKTELLTQLCRHISHSMYRPDFENLLASVEAKDLKIDTTDFNKTFSKAARFGKRVSRAFSFNRTPRKLKRAVSSVTQVMSPFRRDSLISVSGTPRSDLRAMRLASTNDLTNLTISRRGSKSHLAKLFSRRSNQLRRSTTVLSGVDDTDSPVTSIPKTPRFGGNKNATIGPATASKVFQ